MSDHTRGPWRRGLVRDSGGLPVLIYGQADDDQIVALVSPTEREWEANARLIAAAPDLLAACESAKHALVVQGIAVRTTPDDPRVEAAAELFITLSDAIRKAIGQ